jgi:hypothetical protein
VIVFFFGNLPLVWRVNLVVIVGNFKLFEHVHVAEVLHKIASTTDEGSERTGAKRRSPSFSGADNRKKLVRLRRTFQIVGGSVHNASFK